jgi:hypothetical protein
MTTFLVFNDLSATPVVASIGDAQALLTEFSKILIDQRVRGKRVLVTPPEFLQLEVSAGYSVGRWLAEYRFSDQESRLRIKTIMDRRSNYTDCLSRDELESQDVEYKCAGETAVGFFVALSIHGLAISFASHNRWNVAWIELEKYWIDGEDVQHRTFNVLHASRVAHLDTHLEWLRGHEPPPPANGLELWKAKEELFPKLDFCGSVEDQISRLAGNDPRFRAALRGLFDLQRYCDSWNTDNFDIHQLANASGESESTLNMYSDERTFRCPDGEFRIFEWHLKRGNTRIHFRDSASVKRILVGYVGPHLRISSQ